MSDAPAFLENSPPPEAARVAPFTAATAPAPPADAEAATRRGAHRLVYAAMLFSIALGLLFASDSLLSASYDLPENFVTERIVLAAEKWNRGMETVGFAGVAERIRDAVAAARED